jgi:hypothetical protein
VIWLSTQTPKNRNSYEPNLNCCVPMRLSTVCSGGLTTRRRLERLSGHILKAEGYESIDPSHPLGGPDQGADAMRVKHGQRWVMASYFP